MKEYRVEEDFKIILETDDREEAMRVWRERHRENPNLYHEVHQWWDGQYNGICQFKPGDKVRW